MIFIHSRENYYNEKLLISCCKVKRSQQSETSPLTYKIHSIQHTTVPVSYCIHVTSLVINLSTNNTALKLCGKYIQFRCNPP
jgi:hypothetical protein